MDYPIIQSRSAQRFKLHVDGHTAFEDYEYFDGGIAYIHTEVPPELAGRGLGSILARHILDYAQSEGLKVKAVCPFVKAYIEKHPEYQANSVFHQTE